MDRAPKNKPQKGKPRNKTFRPQKGKPAQRFTKKNKRRAKVPSQVRELANEHGLSIAVAFKVFQNTIPLEEALAEKQSKEVRKQQAQQMCEQYKEINFALACLLLKENITPEEHFARQKERQNKQKEIDREKQQRMLQDENQKPAFAKLQEYCEQKTPLCLAKYGAKSLEGIISDFTPYEFDFLADDKIFRIHRLEIKYFCKQSNFKLLQKMIPVDKSIRKKKLRPSHKPDGRYQFPPGVLEKDKDVILALHEGEIVRGTIVWFTNYDIMLKVGKTEVWVFRHAVTDCGQARRAPRKTQSK